MQVWVFLTMMAVWLAGCKVRWEDTSQDKQGRAIKQISKVLAKDIDNAINKFLKNGDTDDIAALIKKGGKVGDEAIIAFRRTFVRQEVAVGNKLRALAQEANKYPPNSKYSALLNPYFDEAEQALDAMLNVAQKYYLAVPEITNNYGAMKKMYAKVNSDYWLNVEINQVQHLPRSKALVEKVQRLRDLSVDGYRRVMHKMHNLPLDENVLATLRTRLGNKLPSDIKELGKHCDEIMTASSQWGDDFFRAYTKRNVAKIEDLIYKRIPKATNTGQMKNYLDELLHELQTMRSNANMRNQTVRNLFSSKHVEAMRASNATYLLEISAAGRKLMTKELGETINNGRVFGVWGNDIYDNVLAWEKAKSKTLSSSDVIDEVDLRDRLYDLQEACQSAIC